LAEYAGFGLKTGFVVLFLVKAFHFNKKLRSSKDENL